jgi:aminopeptidase N
VSREGTDSYVPGHGDPTYSVDRYDVELSYKVEGNHLQGRARLEIELLESTDRLALDLHHLKVDRVSVDDKRVKWRTRRDKLEISLGEALRSGTRLTVAVRYGGTPRQVRSKHLGTAGWEELSDGALAAGQPHGAPSWFPCNDRPDDKAGYRFSVTVPTGYLALVNGDLVDQSRSSSRTTFVYEQAEPMATYLATVHVGRYRRLELDGPVPSWALVPPRLADQMPSAFARQGEMVEAFVDAFGPYPFPSYGVVVTEDDLEIPLESQGFSTFGANFLSDDWDAVRLVAHELAHQWFGNSLTLRQWSDIWLHEGFACYAEWLWSEASGGESANALARRHHVRLADEPQEFVLADPGPDTMFDDRLYKRGALTLHALRLTLGDDAFFGLLHDWVAEHRHGTVTTAEFVESVVARAADADAADALCGAWLWERDLPELPDGE